MAGTVTRAGAANGIGGAAGARVTGAPAGQRAAAPKGQVALPAAGDRPAIPMAGGRAAGDQGSRPATVIPAPASSVIPASSARAGLRRRGPGNGSSCGPAKSRWRLTLST